MLRYLQSKHHALKIFQEIMYDLMLLNDPLHQTLAPCILMQPWASAEANNRLKPTAARSFLPIVFIFVNCAAPTLRSSGTCVVDRVFSLQYV